MIILDKALEERAMARAARSGRDRRGGLHGARHRGSPRTYAWPAARRRCRTAPLEVAAGLHEKLGPLPWRDVETSSAMDEAVASGHAVCDRRSELPLATPQRRRRHRDDRRGGARGRRGRSGDRARKARRARERRARCHGRPDPQAQATLPESSSRIPTVTSLASR